MSTLLHLLLPLGVPLAMDSSGVFGLALALLLVVSLVAVAAVRFRSVSGSVHVADLVTASRRLRGSFRKFTRPNAPGRPQPRAPGLMLPA